MSEKDPLGDFDFDNFFSSVEEAMREGRAIGNITNGFERTAENLDPFEQRRIKLLDDIFSPMKNIDDLGSVDPRQTAITFKYNFERWKSGFSWGNPAKDDFRDLVDNTSLEVLAKTAENEFQRKARLLGREIPGSVEYETLSSDAKRWSVISEIVLEASEIGD